jgi:phage FluMu protein Com
MKIHEDEEDLRSYTVDVRLPLKGALRCNHCNHVVERAAFYLDDPNDILVICPHCRHALLRIEIRERD